MLIVFEMAADTSGFRDDFQDLWNAENCMIEGLTQKGIGARSRLIHASGGEDENAVWFQSTTQLCEDRFVTFQRGMPDAILGGNEIVFMRECPSADIRLMKGLVGVSRLSAAKHLR